MRYAKKWESTKVHRKKQSVESAPEEIQILGLFSKDIKISSINIINELKKTTSK